MNKVYTFKTSLYSGDIIATLPGIREACRRHSAQADLFIWMNRRGISYDGAVHPYGGPMITEYAYGLLKPLLEEQDYIRHVLPWQGQTIHVDLDELRQVNVGMPYGSIHRWPFYKWPDMACDLSVPWLRIPRDYLPHEELVDKVIVNRTSRYHNGFINYFFLQKHQDRLVFAGMPDEHAAFCKEWELEIPHLKVDNFLQLAIAMKSCKFFLGNQSVCYGIAEGLKIPRLLEVCPFAPNVIPFGPNAYDFQMQGALEYLFNEQLELSN